jgi:cell wall-associated NlpC family hydrolase
MRVPLLLLASVLAAACSSAPVVTDGPITGASGDGPTPPIPDNMTAVPATGVPIGTTLYALVDADLRKGSTAQDGVLHVIPKADAVVTVNRTTPVNGFLNVKHGGVEGWALSKQLGAKKPAVDPAPSPRDEAIVRAKAGVGFSYWWGHGRWLPTGPTSPTAGSCSGNCPSCSHSGSYGADCSGYVGKIWQVPSTNSDLTVDSHPYSTVNFDNDTTHWKEVSRGSVIIADALVYNTNGAGHIFLYEKGDGWGSMWAYEAKGCSYGIVHDLRTATSAYKAIRHDGW